MAKHVDFLDRRRAAICLCVLSLACLLLRPPTSRHAVSIGQFPCLASPTLSSSVMPPALKTKAVTKARDDSPSQRSQRGTKKKVVKKKKPKTSAAGANEEGAIAEEEEEEAAPDMASRRPSMEGAAADAPAAGEATTEAVAAPAAPAPASAAVDVSEAPPDAADASAPAATAAATAPASAPVSDTAALSIPERMVRRAVLSSSVRC